MCREFCGVLRRRESASRAVLDVLDKREILHLTTTESGQCLAELLLRCLCEPRAGEMSGRHVYWSLLERVYNPASNTQIVNVEFDTGELDAMTCVPAAHIFHLISRTPAEYARIVERLTSPEPRFAILRTLSPAAMRHRLERLSAAFELRVLSPVDLLTWVTPDAAAVPRAVQEHRGRRFREYDFGARDRKNSRLLVDVMVQSAVANYWMRGRYDSATDSNAKTGERGTPPPGRSDEARTLIRDITHGRTPPLSLDGGLFFGMMTQDEARRATEKVWTRGHYLKRPFTLDIDS